MKPTVLLLTNLYNGSDEEDIFLSGALRSHFNVILSHPLDCEPVEDKVDIVLIRNLWPIFEYERAFEKIKRRLIKKNIRTYNPFTGKCDLLGKDHLTTLYMEGYPVIPTVDKISEIDELGDVTNLFIKPKNKCDAIGAARISRRKLLRMRLRNYVIQPYVNFTYELSFYFIDGTFVYAFRTKKKVGTYKIRIYKPTKHDLSVAREFVTWNGMKYGLQRIDMCRTREGKLLLMEVEDIAPYLNLLKLPKNIRELMVKRLIQSIKKQLR